MFEKNEKQKELFDLIESSNLEGLKELFNSNFDFSFLVNKKNSAKFTPLMRAVIKNNDSIVDLLLEHGANPNDHINGMTSLMLGINTKGQITNHIIDSLAKHGVKFSMPEYHQHALLHAAHLGFDRIVKKLLEVGANINETDEHGINALMAAITQGREEVIDILLAAGIDVKQKTTDGIDAMSLSLEQYLSIVPKLVTYGYDKNDISYASLAPEEQVLVKNLLKPFYEQELLNKELKESVVNNLNPQKLKI